MKKLFFILFFLSITTSTPSWANDVNTQPIPKALGPYSQFIKANATTYLSGQIPIDPKTGKLVAGDFRDQFKQALINLSAIAKAAGGSLDDIAKVTIYVTDLSNFSIINDVMTAQFHQPYPARAVIGIKELPKHANVEIEAIMIHKEN